MLQQLPDDTTGPSVVQPAVSRASILLSLFSATFCRAETESVSRRKDISVRFSSCSSRLKQYGEDEPKEVKSSARAQLSERLLDD